MCACRDSSDIERRARENSAVGAKAAHPPLHSPARPARRPPMRPGQSSPQLPVSPKARPPVRRRAAPRPQRSQLQQSPAFAASESNGPREVSGLAEGAPMHTSEKEEAAVAPESSVTTQVCTGE